MKRLLTLALALCLLLSLGSFCARAEEDDAEPTEPPSEGEDPADEGPAAPSEPGEDDPDDPIEDEPGEDDSGMIELLEEADEEERQDEEPADLPVRLTITNDRGFPCLYQIADEEENELLCLLILSGMVSVAGLPDGSYTIGEIDLLNGGYLSEQGFSLSQDTEEPAELVFGSAEDALRAEVESRWLRAISGHQ